MSCINTNSLPWQQLCSVKHNMLTTPLMYERCKINVHIHVIHLLHPHCSPASASILRGQALKYKFVLFVTLNALQVRPLPSPHCFFRSMYTEDYVCNHGYVSYMDHSNILISLCSGGIHPRWRFTDLLPCTLVTRLGFAPIYRHHRHDTCSQHNF